MGAEHNGSPSPDSPCAMGIVSNSPGKGRALISQEHLANVVISYYTFHLFGVLFCFSFLFWVIQGIKIYQLSTERVAFGETEARTRLSLHRPAWLSVNTRGSGLPLTWHLLLTSPSLSQTLISISNISVSSQCTRLHV